jgi:hypothetical protein
MASDDHRSSQSFPGEDASHTHKTERANTYIWKNPKAKRDIKNPRVKG